MPVETANLWPVDFGEPATLTPLAILRQQGAALGERTQNIVVGRVDTTGDRDSFYQNFYLYCAPLGYRRLLFQVKHDIELYPALVTVDGDAAARPAHNPDELQAILKEIFASEKTRKIIASLLAQSRQ